ncbi:MAG: IMP dehydrogenase, partial [Gammaproteobacteria bacterium]|nr:IMP dehydrogenase [Gammaproteobacteria bacterium]
MEPIQTALTFDDILLVPAKSDVLPRHADLSTRFTRNLSINIPLLSAAMDTVTGARAAICLAQEGGVGVIHRNLSPELQAREVNQVKKYENGVITDPVTVDLTARVSDLLA